MATLTRSLACSAISTSDFRSPLTERLGDLRTTMELKISVIHVPWDVHRVPGLSLAYDRHQLPAERFHAHDGHAFDVGHTAIDHLDAVDGTFPASEIHRTRAFALPD